VGAATLAGVTCYLVRHGAAAPGSPDAARPLTAAGRSGVEALGRALRTHDVAVAEIRHSGLVRARETAEILGHALAPRQGVVAAAGLAPEDDPEVARAELELAPAPVMLVGHLPHLERLALMLLGSARAEALRFAPATAVGLARDGGGWRLALVVAPAPGAPS
jgi:phosphohistidine phosphatase